MIIKTQRNILIYVWKLDSGPETGRKNQSNTWSSSHRTQNTRIWGRIPLLGEAKMILQRSLLSLSLLGLLVLVLSQHSLAESREDKFKRQHVDSGAKRDPGRKYCDRMMRKRGMTIPICKSTNTFVRESYHRIQRICHEAKTPCANRSMHNCYKSNKPLRITVCREKGTSTPPKCKYRMQNTKKQVTVACDGNPLKPVHLE
ncbi:ribonuclease pancreatic delta-type-like isoform X2 [Notamacropus eugenii]|uniref:ribonuclease pancreatic delta-type-like isoform X2 n=1 Tax=Notamacropus eugenii TaxID=9315 RepID=UPI003B6860EB